MNNKKCLVTGANGFIGKHLVKRLIEEGAHVSVTSRSEVKFIGQKAHWIHEFADLTDTREIDRIFHHEFDYIFHLAEKTGGILTKERAEFDVRDNLTMTLNILHECARYNITKPKLVLLTGTTGYPESQNALSEELYFKKEPPEVYRIVGNIKRTIENLTKLYNLDTVILRPTSVYGPHDNFGENCHIIPKLIKDFVNEDVIQIYGDGSEKRDFIYIDDLVDAILLSVEKANLPLNIGYGRTFSIRGLIKIISDIREYIPLQKYLEPKFSPISRVIDTTQSERILGRYAKTDLEEGLRRTINWYLQRDFRDMSSKEITEIISIPLRNVEFRNGKDNN